MNSFTKGVAMLLLSMAAIPAFAQNDSSSFDPYWNLGIQGGVGYTVGESSFSDLLSPAAALSVGYQFTPVFGLRGSLSGWQAKGSVVTLVETYKFNYLQANLDGKFDIRSIFAGYDSERIVNPYAFVGVGLDYRFNNDEAIDYAAAGYKLEHLWEGSELAVAGRVGAGVDFKVSDCVSLGLEYNVNILTDKFNSKDAKTVDWQHNLLAGATFRLGGKKAAAAAAAAAAAVVAEAEAAEAAVKAAEAAAAKKAADEAAAKEAAEKARKAAADKAKADKAKAAAAAAAAEKAPRNIFFDLASSELTAEGEAKVDEIAALAKKYPAKKIAVTGYADAETGSSKYNMKLSENRAEAVCEALVAAGVPADQIVTDYKGDTVQPYNSNDMNRVVIAVLE